MPNTRTTKKKSNTKANETKAKDWIRKHSLKAIAFLATLGFGTKYLLSTMKPHLLYDADKNKNTTFMNSITKGVIYRVKFFKNDGTQIKKFGDFNFPEKMNSSISAENPLEKEYETFQLKLTYKSEDNIITFALMDITEQRCLIRYSKSNGCFYNDNFLVTDDNKLFK